MKIFSFYSKYPGCYKISKWVMEYWTYYHPYLKVVKLMIWSHIFPILSYLRKLCWCNTFRNEYVIYLQKSRLCLERHACFLLYTDAVSTEGTAGAATEGRKGEGSSSGGSAEGPGAAHTDRYQGKFSQLGKTWNFEWRFWSVIWLLLMVQG